MITTSLELALLILSVEFGLLAVAITFFSYRGTRSAEAESTAEASELVSKISNTEEARRTALETVFRDKYQFEGDELTEAVDEFMAREKAFYNAVVGAFLGRGKNKISDLNDELTKVVAPWISITPKKMVDADTAQALAAQKSELESELGETKQVLEKMISEYNRAFRVESGGAAAAAPSASDSIDDEMYEIGDIDDDAGDAGATDDELLSFNLGGEGDDATPAQSPAPDESAAPGSKDIELSEEEASDSDLVSATIDDLEDDPEVDAAATLVDRADKPMTADDLDDLMQSLESESIDDVETA